MMLIDHKPQTVMAWIPARGGSKGLPGKALLDLNGRPVIAHTICAALESGLVDRVLVNTDDKEIRRVSLAWGAEVPFLRPASMAQDDSSLEEALHFQYEWLTRNEGAVPGVMIGMSPTHPFRLPGRLEAALRLAADRPDVMNVRGVVPLTRDPRNYWTLDAKGEALPFWGAHEEPPRGRVHQNLFSFNIVLDCRPHLPPQHCLPVAAALSPLEAVDLDEPKDMDLARLVAARGGPASARAGRAEGLGGYGGGSDRQGRDEGGFELFGKHFAAPERAEEPRILVHGDYPLLGESDIRAFAEATRGSDRMVVSGCEVDEDLHPYRLLVEDPRGYLRYAADIPQAVRGRRQAYPRVSRFAPGLVHVPSGMTAAGQPGCAAPLMWPMSREKLLDAADPLERLQIALHS
ncbi:CMP-N,N'-diacetyllegionaminic acid synthase [Fundidesulfovibrio magnetotacticus]|uniref:CMP-N,N'-diacetyllegionaminic acid synthase n=1 Tax=Fundidesulfovibrio magnetotacticus TaxID=2730080 RepID=A0A6V8LY02_9BACT|nr:hypothetical protein [Fundidesulfovibrio magnetotacticus]GFK94929.1 CMP-N,N'-diacetyllegionaminic acid synthase [Fundidesulfovibrio magnetotacticus]